jgi:hypothetical protein
LVSNFRGKECRDGFNVPHLLRPVSVVRSECRPA